MVKRKNPHYGSTTWIDDLTGATFEREKSWKPNKEIDVNYPHARKWRKLK